MQELESSHSRYMINSCTCFSHLSLCKTKQMTGTFFLRYAIFPIHCKMKFKLLKRAGFLITLRYNLQRGSLRALINEVSKL